MTSQRTNRDFVRKEDTMSTSYAAVLAFCSVTALIIFALVWKFSKKTMKGKFDERQELVRGRGYKYASFTLLGLITLDLLAESLGAFAKLPVTIYSTQKRG